MRHKRRDGATEMFTRQSLYQDTAKIIFWNRSDSRGYVDPTKWQPTYHLYLKPTRL
jgi:hypothetical protein